MTNFEKFHLSESLLKALKAMGYVTPTPIQEQAIPIVLTGRDLVGLAQTGTGKTAAFGIPIIMALQKDPQAQALILVPTRELALQIHTVFKDLARYSINFSSCVLIGGVSMYAQTRAMPRRPRLVIATPGRIIDHLQQRTLSLSGFGIVVLDEADRMLDIGFEPQIRRVLQHVPKQRQSLLFSATFPKTIERLASQYMVNPARVSIGKVAEPVTKIEQLVVNTTSADKNSALVKELNERKGSVLIFARTKHRTDRLARYLNEQGFKAERIHGNRTQGQRVKAMQAFRTQDVRILVATDIASRGIDVPHIAHVVNYDLPEDAKDYVHRIGRTARAGAGGNALCLLTPEDRWKWREISRFVTQKSSPQAVPV